MKIAIWVRQFPPKWLAGTEIATYDIAKCLAKRGHEVHVITLLDKGLPKQSDMESFHVNRIPGPKVRVFGVILFWLRVLSTLYKIKPDIFHIQNLASGVPGFLAKKILKTPYVVWSRGEVYLPWRYKKLISKLILWNANAVLALTEDMKVQLLRICDRDILVIPNGVDFAKFESLSKVEMRAKLQVKTDERLVIFVGRFRPEKGVEYLIKAMEIVRQRDCSIRLVLVGEGPEEENLKSLTEQLKLEDRVEFVGQIPNERVPEYMVASDVFVLPSLSEGFPIVILEAMASGLPIVATKVTGLPEIVKDGENGLLAEPRNPQQIAEKVSLLFGDDALRERISKNNKEEAKKYAWESVVQRLEQVYKNHL